MANIYKFLTIRINRPRVIDVPNQDGFYYSNQGKKDRELMRERKLKGQKDWVQRKCKRYCNVVELATTCYKNSYVLRLNRVTNVEIIQIEIRWVL